MRSKYTLFNDFDNIKILFQYLYMDENNSIVVNNGYTDLTITMNENCDLFVKNMNFPEAPLTKLNVKIDFLIGCIEQLEEQKAQEYPKRFPNRWEEIKFIARSTLALNKNHFL